MSLLFVARKLTDQLHGHLRGFMFWRRNRVRPLTFEQQKRQRAKLNAGQPHRLRCACAQCRHDRTSQLQLPVPGPVPAVDTTITPSERP